MATLKFFEGVRNATARVVAPLPSKEFCIAINEFLTRQFEIPAHVVNLETRSVIPRIFSSLQALLAFNKELKQ
jgi:hypothetical protein